jgi:imidazolonepropionase
MPSAALFTNARILTLAQPDASSGPRRGESMRDLGVIERGYVHVVDGRIAAVGAGDPPSHIRTGASNREGCVVMPAFVDCHTHACWGGDRYGEVAQRLAGGSPTSTSWPRAAGSCRPCAQREKRLRRAPTARAS